MENEEKEEFKIFIVRSYLLIWELGVEGKPKFANQIRCLFTAYMSGNILGKFTFVLSFINIIESGRKKLRRVAGLEEKNKRGSIYDQLAVLLKSLVSSMKSSAVCQVSHFDFCSYSFYHSFGLSLTFVVLN